MAEQHADAANEKQMEIIKYLKAYIRKNKLSEGDRLPSQNQLAVQFQANRNLVRNALRQLAAQGVIYSEQGRGIFVSSKAKPIIFNHENGMGFSEIINQGTRSYESTVLRHSRMRAGATLERLLHLEPEEKVYSLTVLRSMDGVPFAICQSFLPEHLVPGFDTHLEGFYSVNHIIMEVYGHPHPICRQVSIEAVSPAADDIQYLEIPVQMPILKQIEIFELPELGPIEYFCVRARGDRFCFKMSFAEE